MPVTYLLVVLLHTKTHQKYLRYPLEHICNFAAFSSIILHGFSLYAVPLSSTHTPNTVLTLCCCVLASDQSCVMSGRVLSDCSWPIHCFVFLTLAWCHRKRCCLEMLLQKGGFHSLLHMHIRSSFHPSLSDVSKIH